MFFNMSGAFKRLEANQEEDRRSALGEYFRADKAGRPALAERFAKTYGYLPERDPFYGFWSHALDLEAALNRYEYGYGQINYLERVTVGERIDLEAPSEGESARLREEMKEAVRQIERIRAEWIATDQRYFDAGKQAQYEEWSGRPAPGRKVVRYGGTPLFLFQRFQHTPMALGLAYADAGDLLPAAKPLLIPAGIPVEVLDDTTITAPAEAPAPGKKLAVTRIRVNAAGVKQHDGQLLPAMPFEGWVLSGSLR